MKKNKDYYLDYIDKSVTEINEIYEKCIKDLGMGHQSYANFNQRYKDYLDNPTTDLESFFHNELITANSIYDSFRKKRIEHEEKKERSARVRADFDALAQDYTNRINSYPISNFLPQDEEIDKLVTFLSNTYNQYWDDLEAIVRKKYKIGSGNPLQEIVISLADFAPRHSNECPYALIHLKSAYDKSAAKDEIDSLRNDLIKEAAIILNKISKLLSIELQDDYFFNQNDLNFMDKMKKEIDLAIYNFRISAFSSQKHF